MCGPFPTNSAWPMFESDWSLEHVLQKQPFEDTDLLIGEVHGMRAIVRHL